MGKPKAKAWGISMDQGLIEEVDEELLSATDRKARGLTPTNGVLFGKFTNRSQFVNYATRYCLNIAKRNPKTLQTVIDFIDLIETKPEIMHKLRRFLELFRDIEVSPST